MYKKWALPLKIREMQAHTEPEGNIIHMKKCILGYNGLDKFWVTLTNLDSYPIG